MSCGFCGKQQKTRTKAKKFCDSTCVMRHWRWMATHRRIVADAYTECPIAGCGVGIGQYRRCQPSGMQLGCSVSHSMKAAAKGFKQVKWVTKHERRSVSYTDKKYYRDIQIIEKACFATIQYVQCQRSGHGQCQDYDACLDKEIKKKGTGFKAGCKSYKPPVSARTFYQSSLAGAIRIL